MRINILQGAFFPVPPLLGGAVEKIWYRLGEAFAEQGHQVTHVSRKHPDLEDESFAGGVHYVRVKGYEAPANPLIYKFYDLLFTLRALHRLPEADILVTHTFWAPILAHYERKGKIYAHVARYPKGQLKFYRKASRLQTISNAILREMKHQAPRFAQRMISIPYFVEPGSQSNEECSNPPFDVVYGGRIHPEKGIDLLIDALAILKEQGHSLSALMVGPWEFSQGGGGSPYQKKLDQKCRSMGLKVQWSGPEFDHEAYLGRLKQGKIFVYPSIAERGETFGLAPLEAMQMRRAVVVSSLDCFKDFIIPEETGAIFDHRSDQAPSELADQLIRWIENPSQLAKIASNGQHWVSERFSLPFVRDLYLEDFASIVN